MLTPEERSSTKKTHCLNTKAGYGLLCGKREVNVKAHKEINDSLKSPDKTGPRKDTRKRLASLIDATHVVFTTHDMNFLSRSRAGGGPREVTIIGTGYFVTDSNVNHAASVGKGVCHA